MGCAARLCTRATTVSSVHGRAVRHHSASHGASAHFYADDGQLYVNSLAADTDNAISCLQACVADVEQWMKTNRMRLNPQKTQLIWLGSQQQLDKVTTTDIQLLNASIHPLSTVRDLGITIDCWLTMTDHVTAVCRTGYFWLRQLRSVVQSLTSEAAESLVHAFISCRLDYCCLLYTSPSPRD